MPNKKINKLKPNHNPIYRLSLRTPSSDLQPLLIKWLRAYNPPLRPSPQSDAQLLARLIESTEGAMKEEEEVERERKLEEEEEERERMKKESEAQGGRVGGGEGVKK